MASSDPLRGLWHCLLRQEVYGHRLDPSSGLWASSGPVIRIMGIVWTRHQDYGIFCSAKRFMASSTLLRGLWHRRHCSVFIITASSAPDIRIMASSACQEVYVIDGSFPSSELQNHLLPSSGFMGIVWTRHQDYGHSRDPSSGLWHRLLR